LMSVKEFEERTVKAKEMLERDCKNINFRRLYRHRLIQMGNYKLLINFGRSVTIKRRVMSKKDKFSVNLRKSVSKNLFLKRKAFQKNIVFGSKMSTTDITYMYLNATFRKGQRNGNWRKLNYLA